MNYKEFICIYSLNPVKTWFIGFLILSAICSIFAVESSFTNIVVVFTAIHMLITLINKKSCEKIKKERETEEEEKDKIAKLESFLNQQKIMKKYDTE